MKEKTKKIRFGGWTLDRVRLQVFDKNGKSANLTFREFRVLEALALSAGKAMTRQQLLEKARGKHHKVTLRAIDTQIARIRKKLQDNKSSSQMIRSIHGVGYSLFLKRR